MLNNIMSFDRLQYKTQPGHQFSIFSSLCHDKSIYQEFCEARVVNQVN